MSKLMKAMIAAGVCLSLSPAFAADTAKKSGANPSSDPAVQEGQARRDRDSTQQGDTIPGPGAGKHPSSATDNNAPVRSDSTMPNSNSSSPAAQNEDAKRTRDSATQNQTSGNSAVKSNKKDEDSANVGDTTSETRNRDSRKQQGDPAKQLPEPTKK